LPMVSFWGMVGGSLLGCVFGGASIKKRNMKLVWVTVICFMFAFICYLIFSNL
jgi:phosphotransferase system  glucose/maltose/N-acetylglucosamine-specific IIC component